MESDEESVHSDPEPNQADKEDSDAIEELRKKLAIANARVKRSERKGSRGGRARKGRSSTSAMENLVYDTAKYELFKEVKFISNDDELMYATRLVMGMLDLKDHKKLSGQKLAEAEANWIAEHCDTVVRQAINDWRNYVQGELQKYVKEALQGTDPAAFARIPNAKEMFELIMRKGLGKKDPNLEVNQVKFDVVCDELMSKVSGYANWSEGKRHHGLMSFHKPPDAKPDDPTYISISDEAFLVTLWENYYDRWVYLFKKKQLEEEKDEESDSESTGKDGKQKKSSASVKENQDPKAAQKGRKGSRSGGEDKESEEEDPEEEGQEKDPVDPDRKGDPETQLVEVKCPYTRPQGGVQRFGGWNNKGRKRFNDLVAMIEANRRDRKKYLLEVETEALELSRLR